MNEGRKIKLCDFFFNRPDSIKKLGDMLAVHDAKIKDASGEKRTEKQPYIFGTGAPFPGLYRRQGTGIFPEKVK